MLTIIVIPNDSLTMHDTRATKLAPDSVYSSLRDFIHVHRLRRQSRSLGSLFTFYWTLCMVHTRTRP